MEEPLYLIDAIGPFFPADGGGERRRWNWSKIPFAELEDDDGLPDPRRFADIRSDFETFCGRVAALGFTAVTMDDLAHLAHWVGYRPELRRRIEAWRAEYEVLFAIADRHGLGVFLTTDVMTLTPEIVDELGGRGWRGRRGDVFPIRRVARWLREACEQILVQYPVVRGVILRVGECDGLDVGGDFRSALVLRRPGQLRRLLQELLPAFESLHRLLLVRTWSVGAYSIGDLIWNRDTFDAVFDDLDSPALVLSMKYGETDFFRFLPVGRHFFRSRHRKIVELQTRREYEGFGEYPAFVGWQYEQVRDELRNAENLVGCCVWCQTGGWSRFVRRTYLPAAGPERRRSAGAADGNGPGRRDDGGVAELSPTFWTELNTEVTLDLFRGVERSLPGRVPGGQARTAEEAVRRFCTRRGRPEAAAALTELLRLSDEVLAELLYVDELATQKLFFRRLRVPPLLSVYWDNILVNHWVRQVQRALVRDPEGKVRQGLAALDKIERMIELAAAAGAPVEDLLFQYDTFEILAVARRYYFEEEFSGEVADQLRMLRDRYQSRWSRRYEIHLDFRPVRVRTAHLRRILALLLRRQRGYRWVDRILTVMLLRWLTPIFRPLARRAGGGGLESTAMGWESVLR